MVPTVLEALGIEPPETIRGVNQSPIEGVSFAHTFNDAKAPTKHITQYLRDVRQPCDLQRRVEGQLRVPGPSYAEGAAKGRSFGGLITNEVLDDLESSGWELYHVAEDPSECHDLAAKHPDKLRELVSLWWAEAGRSTRSCRSTAAPSNARLRTVRN